MANWDKTFDYAEKGAWIGGLAGSVIPGVGTAVGAAAGGFVGGLVGYFSDDPEEDALANEVLEGKADGSTLPPEVLERVRQYALGNVDENRAMRAFGERMISGEGGVDFNEDLAERLLSGEIDPETASLLNRQIGRQFDAIRRQQGASAARRGIANSTLVQRMLADTDAQQSEALADAYTRTQLQRQGLGAELLSRADASKLQRQGMGADVLARLDANNLSRQQFGINTLLGEGSMDLAQDRFAAERGDVAQQRTDDIWQGLVETGGNIYSEYAAGKDRKAELAQQGEHNAEMRELIKGLKPVETPGETPTPQASPTYWKAQARVPSIGQTTSQRGKSGGTFLPKNASLDSAFGKNSVVKGRMGSNGMFSRGTNPRTSGSRNRSL